MEHTNFSIASHVRASHSAHDNTILVSEVWKKTGFAVVSRFAAIQVFLMIDRMIPL